MYVATVCTCVGSPVRLVSIISNLFYLRRLLTSHVYNYISLRFQFPQVLIVFNAGMLAIIREFSKYLVH